MIELVPFVKQLAKKSRDVNNIISVEDLEQEAWLKILKCWAKIEPMDDTSQKKYITTLFSNRVIDIRRSQICRPDTNWNYKSNIMELLDKTANSFTPTTLVKMPDNLLTEEESKTKYGKYEIKTKMYRLESGRFSAPIHGPEETYLGELATDQLIKWVFKQIDTASDELRKAEADYYKQDTPIALGIVQSKVKKVEEAEISMKIVEALIDGNIDSSSARKVCKTMDIKLQHWNRTISSFKEELVL